MGGRLDFAVMMNPFGEWDASNGDHHMNMGIEPLEWEELFFNVLDVPADQHYDNGVDAGIHLNRKKDLFEKTLTEKGYSMLGRIWDTYQDAMYLPSEVYQLLKECLDVQKKTQNANALSAIKKLILACQEALEHKSGLRLLSD